MSVMLRALKQAWFTWCGCSGVVAESLLQLGNQTSAMVIKTVSTFSALTDGSSSFGPQDLLRAGAVFFVLESWGFP